MREEICAICSSCLFLKIYTLLAEVMQVKTGKKYWVNRHKGNYAQYHR
jgi:hypothetical protein